MISVQVRMITKYKIEENKFKYFEIIFVPCIINKEINIVLVVKDTTDFNEILVLKVNKNIIYKKKKKKHFFVLFFSIENGPK